MKIPEYAVKAVKLLEKNGFEAYFAGGCVRDYIMNIMPHDYDVTTNALPEQIKAVFSGYNVIPTGEKHGTITVIIDGEQIEITTYRIDSSYTDNRHPDKVEFSTSLAEDLKRRDFTINAMVMDADGNTTDLFGGREDIKNGVIRAVGKAEERFNEDALRILRGLRFAARLGFEIEPETAKAVHECRILLKNISAERIREEFTGLLCGSYPDSILRSYRDVIAVFIPEIVPCFEFEQHSPYHRYDVWEHTLHAVKECRNKEKIRIAMFFHDIAKPDCFKQDENGRGHFKGHAPKSAEKTAVIMKRLKFPNRMTEDVVTLISHHSDELNTRYELRRIIGEIGAENVFDLLDVQRADSLSKQDFCRERLKKSDSQEKTVREIIENHECVCIKDLDINGYDLMEIGFSGRKIKAVLTELLENVMKDNIKNERFELINCAKSLTIQ